jgi:hypothetical protein
VRRSRGPSRRRHVADPRIPIDDEPASAQGRLLGIRLLGRKDLPAHYPLPEYLNESHVRELAAETLILFFRGGEPDPVVFSRFALVAENEDDVVRNVDREAAEHGANLGRQRSDRVEHELMWDILARLTVS